MSGRWGVGCYEGGDGRMAWEISHDEIGRDMGSAQRALEGLGIGKGSRVLFCSMLSEAGQFWPWIVGAMLTGAQLSCSDATEAEALRVATFCEALDFDAVLGVTPELVAGLAEDGKDLVDVFDGVRVLGARPGAYEGLAAAGLHPSWFVLCGPAVALAREPGGPAVVDGDEWTLGAEGGHVTVSSVQPRAQEFDRTVTAVRGEITDEGGLLPHPALP